MKSWESRLKYRGILIVPIMVFLILLLLLIVSWPIAFMGAILVYLLRLVSLKIIKIDTESFSVIYPNNPFRRGYSYGRSNIKEIVYIDRSDMVSKFEPRSHINLHFRSTHRVHRIDHILSKKEIREIKSYLQKAGIKFRTTTEVEAHEL